MCPAPQVLVFVHSRKETAKTASFIKDTALKEEKLAKFIKQDRWVRVLVRVVGCGGGGGCTARMVV
jgi:pre-mRNA-splicing helicase BRR2